MHGRNGASRVIVDFWAPVERHEGGCFCLRAARGWLARVCLRGVGLFRGSFCTGMGSGGCVLCGTTFCVFVGSRVRIREGVFRYDGALPMRGNSSGA